MAIQIGKALDVTPAPPTTGERRPCDAHARAHFFYDGEPRCDCGEYSREHAGSTTGERSGLADAIRIHKRCDQ